MELELSAFVILLALYLMHDFGMSLLFRRKFNKEEYFLGKNAPDETQRFFGIITNTILAYYTLVLSHLIWSITFWGLISDIAPLDSASFKAAGLVLGTLSILLMTAVRLNLGSSWRVGLDHQTKDVLVIDGFYRFMRNPYYSFLFLFQFSLILVSPNALCIFALVQTLILLHLQVRQEEVFLKQKYGKEYEDYLTKTNRFLPRLTHGKRT